jgi:vitamin B12 transporter
VYFNDHIRDLIIAPPPLYVPQNIEHARINGLELIYAAEFGDTHINANATWQDPRDTTTGELLQKRARKFGSIAVSNGFGSGNAGAELKYSGERPDFDYAFAPVNLPGYTLINLSAGYKLDKKLDLSLRVDNLLDRDYSEAYGYNTLGRTLFVGLNYQQ